MDDLKSILRNVSYDDVENILEFAAHFCKEIENPELLTDVAESLRLAIETRDVELITKCRKQMMMFIISDGGSAITDSIFDGVRNDDNVNILFEE